LVCSDRIHAARTAEDITESAYVAAKKLILDTIGLEFNKRRQHGGFLNATVAGGYGTAAAACRLLGLDLGQTVNALGIYHSQNCGNRQALYDHTLTKRIQPGWAARNSIWAALLAERGLTGPERIFGGSCNLFLLYGANKPPWPEPEDVVGIRDEWEAEWTSIKRFCSCGAMHAAFDLANDNDLKPEDIDRVLLFLGKGKNPMVGVPWEMGPNPQVDAQFCAPYRVALALNRRTATIAAMSDEAIRADVETQKLAKRVELVHDWKGIDTARPGLPSTMGKVSLPRLVDEESAIPGDSVVDPRREHDCLGAEDASPSLAPHPWGGDHSSMRPGGPPRQESKRSRKTRDGGQQHEVAVVAPPRAGFSHVRSS